MRLPAIVPALVAALVLSGCSGSPGGPDEQTTHDPLTHAQLVGFTLPEWRVGDAWEWSSPQLGSYTYIITSSSGSDWVMDTDNAGVAFFDAQNDISTLGQIRKSDLAGSQGSTRVEFFRFPLKANMTWSTQWDGQDLKVAVTHMMPEMAHIEARRADGTLHASYTYDNRTRYFGDLAFHDANGTMAFSSSVVSASRNHAGPGVRYELEPLVSMSSDLKGGSSQTYTVGPAFTDVWMRLEATCTQGVYSIAAGPPTGPVDERGEASQGPCPAAFSATAVEATPDADEVWGAVITGTPATEGSASIEIVARTLSEVAVG